MRGRAPPPRLAFVGLGWIGRHRLAALAESGAATVAALVEPVAERARAAAEIAPGAKRLPSLDAVLASDVDGVVLATPSALHAAQAVAALHAGKAVFCQKPLGRTATEVARVLAAARAADRLVAVDLCYRLTEGMQRVAAELRAGTIGRVYAADLVFHNAYGPDQSWFYDPAQSGGGCVMDLGIHLVDLVLWALDFPAIEAVGVRLYAGGAPLRDRTRQVEDYGVIRLDLAGDVVARLACSWNLPAGQDAVIEAAFYGTRGGLVFRNVNGSFYDFVAERLERTTRCGLATPPDAWGGRALVTWARRLARGDRFDPEAERYLTVARALDDIYEAGSADGRRPAGA